MRSSRSIFFLVFFYLPAITLCAQGLVFNDQAYNNLPSQQMDRPGAKEGDELLKKTFLVDLKPYCPSVGQQGSISSCVGWSVGYAAMTIQKAIDNKWSGQQQIINDQAYSAMYLYNQIKIGSCDFGAELSEAFKFIREKGNVFYRDFAVGQNCDSVPLGNLPEKALLNRIKDFVTLFKPDDRAEIKVNRVKLALAHLKPVVIGMVVLQNFLSLKPGDQTWYPSVGKTSMFGGHAMVVVGFDETKKAFEVMNSWGEGWGNNGFIWIRYDDFSNYCKYAYQFGLEDKNTNYLEGTLQLFKPSLKLSGSGDNAVLFSSLPVNFEDQRYRLRDAIQLPLEFQLVVENLKKDSYLYVVGFDRQMRGIVFWPHHEKLNKEYAGETETSRVTESYSKATLPGKYNVFRLTEPGIEYLCVLNSTGEISNLVQKISRMEKDKTDIIVRLKKAFNKINFVEANVTDKINFFTTVSKNEIAAIVIEFDSGK